jgi:hypothetical protein
MAFKMKRHDSGKSKEKAPADPDALPPFKRFFFDRRDHELLEIVNDVLTRHSPVAHARKQFFPVFHPHGIKEMAESRGLRMAYALVRLIDTMQAGATADRLKALRSLRDEVLTAPAGPLPVNTSRVLLQIMKDLVRAHGDTDQQLRLAHDFRTTASGKPRQVRKLLERYQLLEMPEAWNQLAFDDHVHDANTKGRKSPTHLIMDAWIKGIRRLRVIYYNYIEPGDAAELMEAAAIMGITLRIGIEFSARFRNRYIQLIWVPRGFPDAQAFLCFLAEANVSALMAEGKKVSRLQQAGVLSLLEGFNRRYRPALNRRFDIALPPLDAGEFIDFVGPGQASRVHLGQFIHRRLFPLMARRTAELKKEMVRLLPEAQQSARAAVAAMDRLVPARIVEECLSPETPSIPAGNGMPENTAGLPPLLSLPPKALLDRLVQLHTGYRITLNLSGLSAADTLEILYDTRGLITRLEIFNLKDHTRGETTEIPAINRLQQAINRGNVIALKRFTRDLITHLAESDPPDAGARIEKLRTILHDIADFQSCYRAIPLKSRIGSDSTGAFAGFHGMGLAIIDTLPPRARREIRRNRNNVRTRIPLHMTVYPRKTFLPREKGGPGPSPGFRLLRQIPFIAWLGYRIRRDWFYVESYTRIQQPGNIVTLGGVRPDEGNGFSLDKEAHRKPETPRRREYLDTRLKNALKAAIGFLPAFASFALTKDWWVLAYLGAFIWFAITGLRNILQSVLGGGGVRRSPLLRWNDYVSWERLTDSLLFTGFSVPLLDVLVKSILLDHGLHMTTATAPVSLYSIMALCNGIYLSAHNTFRGLPREAIIGNLFRSLLSIPVAIGFNAAIGMGLSWHGTPGVDATLQKWAAVISKAASDLVAGFIEGSADRLHNIRVRIRDYESVLAGIFNAYARLELLYPETDVLKMIESPQRRADPPRGDTADLQTIITIHALDLLYFQMYQARAQSALETVLKTLSTDEQRILHGCLLALRRQRTVCRLFIDGMVGRNFSRPLAFYLNQSEGFLKKMGRQRA